MKFKERAARGNVGTWVTTYTERECPKCLKWSEVTEWPIAIMGSVTRDVVTVYECPRCKSNIKLKEK